LLRAEGFTEIRFVEDDRPEATNADMLVRLDEVDFARGFVPEYIVALESGQPITIMAGLTLGASSCSQSIPYTASRT
jgi:hypothetical protein